VRPLTVALQSLGGAGMWYDEFSLLLGDSLSKSVDQGRRRTALGRHTLRPACSTAPA
jgi:hypothetical protein